MIFLKKCLIFSLLIGTMLGCSKSGNQDNLTSKGDVVSVLKVGFPPDENPAEIIRKNKPLIDYIKQKTGIEKAELIVPESYTAAVELMSDGKLDLVYFGGLTYVIAKNEIDITPIARGTVGGTAENYSFIITRKDSGLTSIEQLKGKTFAFGDVASTSGHLIPHQALLAQGIDPNKDFSKLEYTGAHDKTALAVNNKLVDAGAMNARKLPSMIKKGQLNDKDIQVIWKSEPFADYPWAARSNLDSSVLKKLKTAFVELKDKSILSNLGVEGYEETTDKDFDNLRLAAKKLGFMHQ